MVTTEEPPKEKGAGKGKKGKKDADGDTEMEASAPKDVDGDAKMEDDAPPAPVEKTHRDDDLAFLAFASLPRWMSSLEEQEQSQAMELLYQVVTDSSDEFTNSTKSDVQTVNNERWTFCARYLLSFAGVGAGSPRVDRVAVTHVTKAIDALCKAVRATDVADRDRRIVLLSRLRLLLEAIEPYFEQLAKTTPEFLEPLENSMDDMYWRYVMRYYSNTLFLRCDSAAAFDAQADALVARQLQALRACPQYLADVVTNVNTILARSFDYDPTHPKNPVTPTVGFVAAFVERVVAEAGRTDDVDALLRRELALAIFAVRSASATYFSSALPDVFVKFFTAVAMPACIETVDPFLARKSHEPRFSLSGLSYNQARTLLSTEKIYDFVAAKLVELSKKPLTTEAVVYFNIACDTGVLEQCFDAVLVDDASLVDFLFALVDLASRPQNSLAAVPPLLAPDFDGKAKLMFARLGRRHVAWLDSSSSGLEDAIRATMKRCLKWADFEPDIAARMRACGAELFAQKSERQAKLFAPHLVPDVLDMALLANVDRPDTVKYFEITQSTARNTFESNCKPIVQLVSRLCIDAKGVRNVAKVPTFLQEILRVVMARAFATSADTATSTLRTMCALHVMMALVRDNSTRPIVFSVLDVRDLQKFFEAFCEVITCELAASRTDMHNRRVSTRIDATLRASLVSRCHELIVKPVAAHLKDHSWTMRNKRKVRCALDDAKSRRLVEMLVKEGVAAREPATPRARVLKEAALACVRSEIGFVAEVAPKEIPAIMRATAQHRELDIPVVAQLERKFDANDEDIEVYSHGRQLAHTVQNLYAHRYDESLDGEISALVENIVKCATDPNEPAFRHAAFLIFKDHLRAFDFPRAFAAMPAIVDLLIRDNDVTPPGSSADAMVDDENEAQQPPKRKPFMRVDAIVKTVLALTKRAMPKFAQKRALPPVIARLVKAIVAAAQNEAATIKNYNDLKNLDSKPFIATSNALLVHAVELLTIGAQAAVPALVDVFVKTYAASAGDSWRNQEPSRAILDAIQKLCGVLNPARKNQRRSLGLYASTVIHDYVLGGLQACADPNLHNDMIGRELPTVSSIYFNLFIHLEKDDYCLIALASLHESAPPDFYANFLHAMMVGSPAARLETMRQVLDALEWATRVELTDEQEQSNVPQRLHPQRVSPQFTAFVDRVLLNKLRPAKVTEMEVETANYRLQLLSSAFEAVQEYPAYLTQRVDVVQRWMRECVREAYRTNSSFSLAPLATAAVGYLRQVEQYEELMQRERDYDREEKKGEKHQNKTLQLRYDDSLPWSDALVDAIAAWVKRFRAIADDAGAVADLPQEECRAFARNARLAGLTVLKEYGFTTQAQVEAQSKGGSVVNKTAWREPLVELLDLFCVDDDADIRVAALNQNTETWGSNAKAPTGAARRGLQSTHTKKAKPRAVVAAVRGGRGGRGRGRGGRRGRR